MATSKQYEKDLSQHAARVAKMVYDDGVKRSLQTDPLIKDIAKKPRAEQLVSDKKRSKLPPYAPQIGDSRINSATNDVQVWNGSQWVAIVQTGPINTVGNTSTTTYGNGTTVGTTSLPYNYSKGNYYLPTTCDHQVVTITRKPDGTLELTSENEEQTVECTIEALTDLVDMYNEALAYLNDLKDKYESR